MIWIILGWMINTIIMAFFYVVRPILGPAECKYGLSCMPFAHKQLAELPTHKALWRITRRVLSCNPWSSYQEDLAL